jgi:20S proteasome alpha/beta subunit
MNSETGNGFETEYHDRVRKIRKAAAIALKEIDELRSGRPMPQERLDAEVARIAQEKLQPYGCDLVVHSMGDGVTRFLIKVQSTGRKYDLIKSFFHRDEGSPLAAEV